MKSVPFARGILEVAKGTQYVYHSGINLWVYLSVSNRALPGHVEITFRGENPRGGVLLDASADLHPEVIRRLAVERVGQDTPDYTVPEHGIYSAHDILRPSRILAGDFAVRTEDMTPRTRYVEISRNTAFVGFYESDGLLEPCLWGYKLTNRVSTYVPKDSCYPPIHMYNDVRAEFGDKESFRRIWAFIGLPLISE